jgi:hypothetical protein
MFCFVNTGVFNTYAKAAVQAGAVTLIQRFISALNLNILIGTPGIEIGALLIYIQYYPVFACKK